MYEGETVMLPSRVCIVSMSGISGGCRIKIGAWGQGNGGNFEDKRIELAGALELRVSREDWRR